MIKLLLKLFAASLSILLSATSYGLSSICSGEFLPLTGKNTVKHEVVWSYHDNWISDMYVEVYTAVEGEEAAERSDEYVMEKGGTALHYLPELADGEYRLTGYIQTGYPEEWGFDGYFGVECPLWIGNIKNPSVDTNADDLASSKLAVTSNTTARNSCTSATSRECAAKGSMFLTSGASVQSLNEASLLETRQQPSIVVTGMIQAAEKDVLILRTDTGRYVPMIMPAQYKISRHTDVNLAEVKPGDVVGVVHAPAEKGENEIVLFRVYRGSGEEVPAPQSASAVDLEAPGVEVRGVVKAVGRDASGGNLRLTRANGEASLRVSQNPVVTVINPAVFSELQPFAVRARVVAQEQLDGSLLVSTIEILQSHGRSN